MEALIGKNPPAEELRNFSLEKNVTDRTVPCFLWQTAADDLVPVENSYLFANALKEKGVPFAHHVFQEGFHGLSVASEDFFRGKFGEPYTMAQVMRAVQAVKAGNGANVSDRRRAELEAQFPDPPAASLAPSENDIREQTGRYEDVRQWVSLASLWMRR